MSKARYLLAAAALFAAAACSRADSITAPERRAQPRYDGGYIGSGYNVTNDTTTLDGGYIGSGYNTAPDTTQRGGGYIGSGY
jgi:opacity protein-like surface antigen